MAPAVDLTSTYGHSHAHSIHYNHAGDGHSDRAYETADVSVFQISSSWSACSSDTPPRKDERDERKSQSQIYKILCSRNRVPLLINFYDLAPQGNS